MIKGKIDVSQLNYPPEKDEFETARYLADMGKDIVFIRPSSIPDIRTPDIKMDGVEWEIKCPHGSSEKNTIESNFRKAITQSRYLIFDLRHVKLPEKLCITQLEREFGMRKYLKKMLIICKNGKLRMYPDSESND